MKAQTDPQRARTGHPAQDDAKSIRESNRRMALALVGALVGLLALLAFVLLSAGLDPEVVP